MRWPDALGVHADEMRAFEHATPRLAPLVRRSNESRDLAQTLVVRAFDATHAKRRDYFLGGLAAVLATPLAGAGLTPAPPVSTWKNTSSLRIMPRSARARSSMAS